MKLSKKRALNQYHFLMYVKTGDLKYLKKIQ